MKLDFLKTLHAQQPCGLRAIIEPLNDSYPVLAFSDWKDVAAELMDAGFVRQYGNGQYTVTPAGMEAIEKGASFLEDDTEASADDSENEPELTHRLSKPAVDHPWRQPLFTKKQESGEIPLHPSQTKEPETTQEQEEPEALETSDHDLDELAHSLSRSITQSIEKMSTDDLLIECRLSKDLMGSLESRRELAVDEINRRLEGL